MAKTAREAALCILHAVAAEEAYANIEMAKFLAAASCSRQDAALLNQLVYGVLQRQAALDYLLAKLCTKPLAKLPLWILLILRLSLFQLVYMDKIPASAAVNEGVKLAKKYGHAGTAGLVNGVLRSYLRRSEELSLPTREQNLEDYLSITLSHPRWLVRYLLREYDADAVEQYCLYNNQAKPLSLRTNTLQMQREALAEALRMEGFDPQPGFFAPEALRLPQASMLFTTQLFQDGAFQVQEESSMLAAHALGAQADSRVLDLCAAPGGKTTHIAQLTKDAAEIHAFDIHPHKVALIEQNCRRLGIHSVQALAADGRNLGPAHRQWADYLLLDAPCSGLGVLAGRPDLRWRKQKADISKLAALSAELLAAAADYLRPGGVLLFSTCTITREENQQAVARFLAARPDFSLQAFPQVPAFTGFDASDTADMAQGFLQILPHKHHLDGFFMARLRKGVQQ